MKLYYAETLNPRKVCALAGYLHLRGRKYLVDDLLTVADFAVAAALPYADKARLPLDGFVEIERWYAQLNELPAWRDPFPAAKRTA